MTGSGVLDIFAVTPPGIEPIVADELRLMGIDANVVAGGVEWSGDLRSLYRANLRLRAASRVLVRIARFRARSFIELERHLKRIDWSEYLVGESGATLRVSSSKSRLYHERAIAERFQRVITASLGSTITGGRDADDADELPHPDDGSQLLIVRFHRDECVISADASGELLHRRGYRLASGKAPLRETIAAAVLLASGWSPDEPMVDPFCGSGTIPIEAALIAGGIAPGLANPDRDPRRYTFERWPGFASTVWREVVEDARQEIRTGNTSGGTVGGTLIRGSDRDSGAIVSARQNAERAGVAAEIDFEVAALSACRPPSAEEGWIVTNPPYGVRVGDAGRLRDLYAALGRVTRERYSAWSLAMLSADWSLATRVGADWVERLRTSNGGVPVQLLVSRSDRR